MATVLGHGGPSQVIVHVKNVEATAGIAKGQLCKIDVTAGITFAEDGTPIMPVLLSDVEDGTAGEGGEAFGVIMETLGHGKVGRACLFGMTQVILNGALSAYDVVAPTNTTIPGALKDAAGATTETPVAYLLEAITAGEVTTLTLKWAFVDFLAGKLHRAAGAGDTFHGISY